MNVKNYISESFQKMRKDALSKLTYDLFKYLLILLVVTIGAYFMKNWTNIVEFLFIRFDLSLFQIVLTSIFIIFITIMFVNILFRRKYNQLKIDNYTDELTGLKNHKALKEDLSLAISSNKDHPLSLILIDIDNFKGFNDEHSHETADILIKKLGELLASDKRATDQTYRYHQAGDEFIIVAKSTNISQAKFASERKRKLIEDNVFDINGKYHNITVSCGYVELNPSENYSDFTNRVSKAMLQAKANGRNCSKSLN